MQALIHFYRQRPNTCFLLGFSLSLMKWHIKMQEGISPTNVVQLITLQFLFQGAPFLCMVRNNVKGTMFDFTSSTTSGPEIATRQLLFSRSF